MKADSKTYKIFIVAGEASGDVLGGKLIASLRELHPNLEILAVGGSSIEANGAKLLFDCSEIALMGFLEILPKLPKILWRLKQTADAIESFAPDMLITIDSPGFNFRLVSRLRNRLGKQFPIVHYVAPTVWAYKKERAKVVARLYDHILLLLPFEKPYFDQAGVQSTYVGHPIIEDKLPTELKTIKLTKTTVPILVMPGSRIQELRHMGKLFANALKLLETKYHIKIKVLIPTLHSLKPMVEKLFTTLDKIVSNDIVDKQMFFKNAQIGLVKSGTSSLEAARHGIPCVVGYKMSPFTYMYLKRIVHVKFISLINLLLNKQVIPELVQDECTAKRIADELYALLNKKNIKSMKEGYNRAFKLLNNNQSISPSKLAAKTILHLLTKN